jgi:hypothetical protein
MSKFIGNPISPKSLQIQLNWTWNTSLCYIQLKLRRRVCELLWCIAESLDLFLACRGQIWLNLSRVLHGLANFLYSNFFTTSSCNVTFIVTGSSISLSNFEQECVLEGLVSGRREMEIPFGAIYLSSQTAATTTNHVIASAIAIKCWTFDSNKVCLLRLWSYLLTSWTTAMIVLYLEEVTSYR